MVPTRRFWLLIACGIPLAVVAATSNSGLILLIYNVLIFAAAWVTTKLAPDIKGLKLVRKFDPALSVRVPNRISLTLENLSGEPIAGRMRDEPPPGFPTGSREFSFELEPGRSRDFSYEVIPPERGLDYFRGTFMRLKCPLGLVEKEAKLQTEQPVRVYPNVLALREFDLLRQKGKLRDLGIRKSRMRGIGTEFESLRDYSDGDDYRKIDWKASARRDKLTVRQYEVERNQPVVLCIDVGRRMLSEVNGISKLDYALDSLLMLMHAASVAGDLVGLIVYSERVVRYIPPKKGRHQTGIIIQAIHDLMADPLESDPVGAFSYLSSRWKRRSLIVAFSDVEDKDEASRLAVALAPLANRHVTLLARVADPRLKELTQIKITETNEIYQKTAALMVDADRKLAGTVLDSHGVHTLEAEPQELASALVSFYFMVKDRGMI